MALQAEQRVRHALHGTGVPEPSRRLLDDLMLLAEPGGPVPLRRPAGPGMAPAPFARIAAHHKEPPAGSWRTRRLVLDHPIVLRQVAGRPARPAAAARASLAPPPAWLGSSTGRRVRRSVAAVAVGALGAGVVAVSLLSSVAPVAPAGPRSGLAPELALGASRPAPTTAASIDRQSAEFRGAWSVAPVTAGALGSSGSPFQVAGSGEVGRSPRPAAIGIVSVPVQATVAPRARWWLPRTAALPDPTPPRSLTRPGFSTRPAAVARDGR
ncbi:MAG: hypothetical protein ACRC35_01825 [Angustibacter sp.]